MWADQVDLLEAEQLLQMLETYSVSREELIQKTGLPVSQMSELLLVLELEGLIEVLPGDEIRRIH